MRQPVPTLRRGLIPVLYSLPGKTPWNCGRQPLILDHPFYNTSGGPSDVPIAVECQVANGPRIFAFLDTGCGLAVIGGELAELLKDEFGSLETESLATRFGSFEGEKARIPIVLIAHEGNDIQIEATVLLAPSWPWGPVLGLRNCLDAVRLAIEPPRRRPGDGWLYFGPLEP